MPDRRTFLLAAAAGIAGASARGSEPGDGAAVSPSDGTRASRVTTKPLSAVISIGREKLLFREEDGEDLGDFQGPGFVQRCVRATRPNSPLTVFFRPDRDSERVEVVFELGRLWGEANAQAANLDAYHVAIHRDGKTVVELHVPRHWWFSAWRWQNAPRPIVYNVQDFVHSKLLFPFSRRLLPYCPATKTMHYAGPMDPAGVFTGMPAPGERPDIGPITEWQAEYLATGRRSALGSLMSQAEAAGSVPWHIRDETTGAPINIYDHPTIHWKIQRMSGTNEYIQTTRSDWNVDDAHQPALAYVPYLLTGDPYYLEKLQFQGTWNAGWGAYHRERQNLPVLYPGETRSYAWSLRTLAQLARVSPKQTPRWLLPRSYWKRMLDDNLTYFTREFVRDSKPESALFRAATRQDEVAAWQEAFLAFALGWAVYLGFDEWRKAFEWKMGSTIALSDGKSGWPRQWCCPYYYKLRATPDGPCFRSWTAVWDAFRKDPQNKVVEPLPRGTTSAQSNSWGYIYYIRSALALAAHLGMAEAGDPFKFVEAMTLNGLRKRSGPMAYRWAFFDA